MPLEPNNNSIDSLKLEVEAETKILRQYLDALGIEYKKSYGLEKLKELFQDNTVKAVETKTASQEMEESRKEGLKLVRIILTSNKPEDKNLVGDVFNVSNKAYEVTRVIPFQVPTHIEFALLQSIKEKVIVTSTVKRDSKNRPIIVEKKTQMYNIQELPPLTEKEFSDLKDMQQRDPEFFKEEDN